MKKHPHYSLRAMLVCLFVLLSIPALAEEVEIDGINYELIPKAKQATVIKKSSGKYYGQIAIPASVEYNGITYSVTSMGEDAFYGCSGLTSVTIPNSVTSIASSFYDCKGLTSVYISDLAAWCKIAFRVESANPLYYAKHMYLNGEEINDLVIPDGVTSIGGYAFYGYSGLTSVTIPNSVLSIGWYAFGNCSGLTSVTIPNSVSSIEAYAFAGCSGLTSVVIPNSVTSIEGHAFWNCSGLSSITIPNSVTKIENGVFSSCI